MESKSFNLLDQPYGIPEREANGPTEESVDGDGNDIAYTDTDLDELQARQAATSSK